MSQRPGWGCPSCGKIYWAMPLMKKDFYCDDEWVKVTVKYDDMGKCVDELWHFEETGSKENQSLGETTNEL